VRGMAPLGTKSRGSVGSGGFGWLDAHVVAKGLDLTSEAMCVSIRTALLEPVGAEIRIWNMTIEYVVSGNEDRVADSLSCLGVTDAPTKALELGAEIGSLRASRGLGSLGEIASKPL